MEETAKQDFITRIKALAAVSEETKPEDIPDFTVDEMQKLLEIFAGKNSRISKRKSWPTWSEKT